MGFCPPTRIPAGMHARHRTGETVPARRRLIEEGPSRSRERPTYATAVERQPPLGSDGVGLTDLPDELLRVVAQRVADVYGEFVVAALLPWLMTCRRLAAVGYSAVERLTLSPRLYVCSSSRRPPSSAAEDFVSARGKQTLWQLKSLVAFLKRVHCVRTVQLQLVPCCCRHEYETTFESGLWLSAVLRALSHLPIRSLTACGAAVSALADAQTGSVPLRRVDLCGMNCYDEGHGQGAISVLVRHQRSLEVLRMGFVGNTTESAGNENRAWSVESLLNDIGRLPALKALTLDGMSAAAAAAVAAACPELESLTVLADYELLDERVWGCWRFPEALPRLSSLVLPSHVRGSGFSLMVRGRRLHRLVVPPLRCDRCPFGTRADRLPCGGHFLEDAAALPEVLCISGRVCPRSLLERLADGPAEVASLQQLDLVVRTLSTSKLAPLSRLTGLTHLRLRVAKMPEPVSWPPLVGLRFLYVAGLLDGVTSLLAALAASPTRHSLQGLHLDVAARTTIADAEVAAAAPRLVALRQLTIGRVEWTFARGTVVGRWPVTGKR